MIPPFSFPPLVRQAARNLHRIELLLMAGTFAWTNSAYHRDFWRTQRWNGRADKVEPTSAQPSKGACAGCSLCGRSPLHRTRELPAHTAQPAWLPTRIPDPQQECIVPAVVTTGRKVGTYVGRVAIRASGSFNLQTKNGLVQGIHHRCCTLLQRANGYGYS